MWRCKGRITAGRPVNENRSTTNADDQPGNTTNTITPENLPTPLINDDTIRCVCGRPCKGRRGLTAHKRSCAAHRTLSSLYREGDDSPGGASSSTGDQHMNEPGNNSQLQAENVNIHPNDDINKQPSHKPGLNLPRTPTDWKLANAYFHSIFDTSSITGNLDTFVQEAQDKIYDYFRETHVKKDSSHLHSKYKEQSVKSLKRCLTQLKQTNGEIEEIRFVSKLIRSKLSKREPVSVNDNLTERLKLKFWSTCHDLFNKATNSIPTFTIEICEKYFQKVLECIHSSRFLIPGWIPKLNPPKFEYDDTPPSYKEIATAVNRCRAAASPCPLDGLSVIILKRCPIIRTLLHLIIKECWKQRRIPSCWKKERYDSYL